MIALRHVGVEQQGRRILVDVNFEVEKGEFAFLLGQTGAGKSTVLQLILFERRPTQGVVLVGKYDSQTIRDRDIPALRRRVSMVSQSHRLLRDRTVYENVAFAMEVTGTPRSVVKRRTLALLADEPTANLDPETTDLVMQILAEVQAAVLGTVGSTGRLDGIPQLHFEIMRGEEPINPALWLAKSQ